MYTNTATIIIASFIFGPPFLGRCNRFL